MQKASFRLAEQALWLGRYQIVPCCPDPIYPTNYFIKHYQSTEPSTKPTNEAEGQVKRMDVDDTEMRTELPESTAPLVVANVDLCLADNLKNHNTAAYEIADLSPNAAAAPFLVVRRGQPFSIKVKLDRPYNLNCDKIQIQLQTGKSPTVSKKTDHRLPMRTKLEPQKWSACLESEDWNVLTLSVQASPRAIIGKWRLYIETSLRKYPKNTTEPRIAVLRYKQKTHIYVLFNPWCKEDRVFLPDEDWRDEAILNETGTIYTGNYRQVVNRPWSYGQFDDTVLDMALNLLDKAQLMYDVRHDPIKVVRAISTVVTGCLPERGVIKGNWSGKYKLGTPPTVWLGSVSILEEHARTELPVKYGQCWVFAGLCTTLCRTLGIPTRTVTNFNSAHDCDGSTTMDFHWQYDGMPMTLRNGDYIWSFHTWNEAWIKRPDLTPGYDGWQAFDSTPQESATGAVQVGPCSVLAIKEGYMGLSPDNAAFFAEVNADKLHWVLLENATWILSTDKNRVGKNISTKQPRSLELSDGLRKTWMLNSDPERKDLTQDYKYMEGSKQEQTAYIRANLPCTRTDILANPFDDVKFEFDLPRNVMVGKNFEIHASMQNQCRHWRGVSMRMHFYSCHYTGVIHKLIKKQVFDIDIGPIQTEDCMMRMGHEQYLEHCLDHLAFKVKIMATVLETGQIFTSTEEFRLRRPALAIEAAATTPVGGTMMVCVKLVNPLPISLTNGFWRLEGAGVTKLKIFPHRDILPYETTDGHFRIYPRRKGSRQLNVCFTSKELPDVTSTTSVEIREER